MQPVASPVLRPRVLVADDDPESRDWLGRVLARLDAEVVACGDGVELIEAMGRGPWHLVIADVVMPWMDGFSFAAALRRFGVTTPVLLMSGHPGIDGSRVAALPDVCLLWKPIATERLVETVRTLLARD